MEQEVEQYRDACMALCNNLLVAFEENREAADRFCNGEIHQTYVTVNDAVAGKIRKIKTKIQNL